MDVVHGKRFLTLVFCFLGVLASGCAEFGRMPSWMPFQKQSDGKVANIRSPAERIKQLQQLARKAAKADAPQRQQVGAELARQFDTEEDPLIRAEIVRTVGKYRSNEADSVLRAALEDLDAEVRMVACGVWGEREGPEPATLLGRTLGGDVNIDVRLAAARALAHSKDPAAIMALGDALEDKDPAMQVRAVKSLRSVTGRDFGNDVNRWRQYVKAESPQPAEPLSIVQRLRRMF